MKGLILKAIGAVKSALTTNKTVSTIFRKANKIITPFKILKRGINILFNPSTHAKRFVQGQLNKLGHYLVNKYKEPPKPENISGGILKPPPITSKIFNYEDGEKMANNLLKSLLNARTKAEIYGGDTTLLTEAIERFYRYIEKYGYSEMGNLMLYKLRTGEIDQFFINELYGSGDNGGEIRVVGKFLNLLRDANKIDEEVEIVRGLM